MSARFKVIDAIRGTAAMMVVFGHAYQFIWPEIYAVKPPSIIFDLLWYCGHFAVSAFIATSGFCLMLPVMRQTSRTIPGGYRNFYIRRLLRIGPPHLCSMLLSLLLIYFYIGEKTGTHWDVSLPVTPKAIITHLALVNNFFPDVIAKINGVFWSIALEFQLYFFFPVLVPLFLSLPRIVALFLTTFAAYALSLYLDSSPFYSTSIHLLAAFSAGIATASLLGSRFETKIVKSAWGWVIISGCLTGIILLITFRESINLRLPIAIRFADLLLAVGISIFLLRAISGKDHGSTPASVELLARVGHFSYSIYLMHFPLLQVFWQLTLQNSGWDPLSRYGIIMFLGVPVVIGACWLFFLACERPFLSIIQRYRASSSD